MRSPGQPPALLPSLGAGGSFIPHAAHPLAFSFATGYSTLGTLAAFGKTSLCELAPVQ